MSVATAPKTIVVFTLLFFVTLPVLGQITITSSFYSAKAGQRETESEYEADDTGGFPATVPCVSSMLSASGANQTWDFTDTCTFSSPPLVTVSDYGTDVAGDVPRGTNPAFASGNYYLREYETNPSSEASTWAVLELTASAAKQIGVVTVEDAAAAKQLGVGGSGRSALAFDTTVVLNDPVSTALVLPLQYLTAWSDSTSFTIDGTTVAIAEDNVIDGWGTLITPAGSIDALRLSNERRSYVIMGGPPILTEVQYNYEFLTNGLLSAFIYHNNAGTASGAGYITTSSVALPVELASFDVVRNGQEAHLSWRTLSELNNVGFGIEQSVDGDQFQEIAFVMGSGTSTSERQYSYTLELVKTGIHRFRLRQVDLDGSFSYSPVVELNYEAPAGFALLPAYPNPFNPSATITYELASASEITLDVFDMLGQRVRRLASGSRNAGRYEVKFDATGLPSGLYVYRLLAGTRSETRSMMLLR